MVPRNRSLLCSLLIVLLWSGCAGAPHRRLPPTPPAPTAPTTPPALPHDTSTLVSGSFGPAGGPGEVRRINVYLPPAYRDEREAYFPVLYMPDGGIAEDFPHITRTIDGLIAEGAIPPMLVVGIENTERRRDLTGPTEVATDREIAPEVGGSAAFRSFLRDELRPEIEARYRCSPQTAIVGESLAGLFVIETFLLEPALFHDYIAISPSLWWNDHMLVKDAAELLPMQAGVRNTLFLSVADETNIQPHTDAFADILREHAPNGLVWHYEPRRDMHHDTIFRAMAERAFRQVFGRLGE